MSVTVRLLDGEHRLQGDWAGVEVANRFLTHLGSRAFSPATVRAYAPDVANLARFLDGQRLDLGSVAAVDVFAWIDWQGVRTPASGSKVVWLRSRTAAPATVNRRVAAVRALFEFLVISGAREANPVPAPRRGQGLRPAARGMLGHLGPGRARVAGRLVREQRWREDAVHGRRRDVEARCELNGPFSQPHSQPDAAFGRLLAGLVRRRLRPG